MSTDAADSRPPVNPVLAAALFGLGEDPTPEDPLPEDALPEEASHVMLDYAEVVPTPRDPAQRMFVHSPAELIAIGQVSDAFQLVLRLHGFNTLPTNIVTDNNGLLGFGITCTSPEEMLRYAELLPTRVQGYPIIYSLNVHLTRRRVFEMFNPRGTMPMAAAEDV